jgi:D-3-phosphoglycerate dehydrogenase
MAEHLRVLVSDSLSEAGLQPLYEVSDIEVDVRTSLTPSELIDIIGDYDALLVRSSTSVTAEVIRAGKKLRVVARAGVGVDNIDVEAATQAGVIVVNAPTGNVVAAAEHTIAMLMALSRQIPQADAHVRAGSWKRNQFMGVEVRNKILGTVGLGRVAQEVVRRAQGLGMHVVAFDPYITAEFASQRSVRMVDLDTLLAQSDFLTVHVPLTSQTTNLIDRRKLRLMKPSARVLNVARGGVINEQDLADAIAAGEIAGAAIDVFTTEPLPLDNPLRTANNVILTPHLGGSTLEAQDQVAEDVALQVIDVLHDLPARYAVNAPIIPPTDLDFLVPYIDLAERMGSFLEQLAGEDGISKVEVTAYGALADFDLAYINAAIIKGLMGAIMDIRVNLVNAMLLAERRGINVIEQKIHKSDMRYDSLLSLTVHSSSQPWTVRGTVLQSEPVIVSINDLWVDFPAIGNLLISSHRDRPGIIGHVGTRLGESDINISFMHVGRRGPRTDAIMVLGTDEPTPPELLNQLASLQSINWLKAITL